LQNVFRFSDFRVGYTWKKNHDLEERLVEWVTWRQNSKTTTKIWNYKCTQLYSSNDNKQIKRLKQETNKNKQNVHRVDRTIRSYNYQLLTSKNDVRITLRNVCHEGTSVISNLTESLLMCLLAWWWKTLNVNCIELNQKK